VGVGGVGWEGHLPFTLTCSGLPPTMACTCHILPAALLPSTRLLCTTAVGFMPMYHLGLLYHLLSVLLSLPFLFLYRDYTCTFSGIVFSSSTFLYALFPCGVLTCYRCFLPLHGSLPAAVHTWITPAWITTGFLFTCTVCSSACRFMHTLLLYRHHCSAMPTYTTLPTVYLRILTCSLDTGACCCL